MALASKQEKEQFVRDLVTSVTKQIIDNIPNLPKDWDGIELRQYIADTFRQQVLPLSRKSLKAYKNEILVRNI